MLKHNNLSRAIRMSLIESCQSLGIDVAPEANIQEIIDILKTQVSGVVLSFYCNFLRPTI
jgi:hypothetical protein